MSNGSPWLPDKHDPVLRGWAGRISDKEIGTITGHSERKVCERRNELGLPEYHPQRVGWSRREHLLASASGLLTFNCEQQS